MNSTAPQRFTAMIYREDGGFVSICPELDVASQGDTVEEASANLREAVELFIESADEAEVARRLNTRSDSHSVPSS